MIHIAIQSFFESCTVLDLSTSCGDIFHCPITHYVKENFIWSALNTWGLHFIECSFILVLCSKLERNVRYFFSRIFGILSYCVPSYLPVFWDKQSHSFQSLLVIVSASTLTPSDPQLAHSHSYSLTSACALQDLLELGKGHGQYAKGEFSTVWVAEHLVSCLGCSCTLIRCLGWAVCTVF